MGPDVETWLAQWAEKQPDGRLGFKTEEGAREAWDFQQERIDKLKQRVEALTAERDSLANTVAILGREVDARNQKEVNSHAQQN